MKAVTNINTTGEPPNCSSCAIFCERMLLFFESIHHAKIPHNKNTPRNPDKKDFHETRGIIMLTINAAIATDHHGKYKPATKLNKAVNNIEEMSFILFMI